MTYERDFRRKLGFNRKNDCKDFLQGKNIICVNWEKINEYNKHIKNIIETIYDVLPADYKCQKVDDLKNKLNDSYELMKDNDIIPRLNNQGRDHANVYFNWMRGYMICELFLPALSKIFSVSEQQISHIGADDLTNIETFNRSSTADLQLTTNDDKTINLEIQSGFTGANDIKESKINEAARKYQEGILTYIVHIDILNGKTAIIDISSPDLEKLQTSFVKNERFEGMYTLKIEDDWFRWNITDNPKPIAQILYTLK